MANRSQRATTAKQTLKISQEGFYLNQAGDRVRIKSEVHNAVSGTVHYPSDQSDSMLTRRDQILPSRRTSTRFELVNCTTLQAASRATQEPDAGHVACLNFASAKNPGGGFLGGSQAQEESLARASALYQCIHSQRNHYEEGQGCGTCLYTDSILFSPAVPVFRNDDDELLDEPYLTSFITSPAVNAGALRRNEPNRTGQVEAVMLRRFELVLSVAIINQVDQLILGAWGCGVFKNPPEVIADVFHYHLVENPHLANSFTKIVLAVYDRSKDLTTFEAFQNRFSGISTLR